MQNSPHNKRCNVWEAVVHRIEMSVASGQSVWLLHSVQYCGCCAAPASQFAKAGTESPEMPGYQLFFRAMTAHAAASPLSAASPA